MTNFAYCRVSPSEGELKDHVCDIKAAGVQVDDENFVIEISGAASADERPAFHKLLGRMKAGDLLIVPKLDGLGRNTNELRSTVERLGTIGVRVRCLALCEDLTDGVETMPMRVITAVSDFERELLIERTKAGMTRAKDEGKQIGRPSSLDSDQQAEVVQRLAEGQQISRIARSMKVSRTTVVRIREKASE